MLLLDTHAWLWWSSASKRLSLRARRQIDRARQIGVPAVCVWEVSTLVTRGRIRLDRDVRIWVIDALAQPRVRLVDLTAEIAVTAGTIPSSFHGDPIDRMVVATALELRAPLVTADERLKGWPGLEIVW
jgi:PIN domain nuclease of toxin-antitoxin system